MFRAFVFVFFSGSYLFTYLFGRVIGGFLRRAYWGVFITFFIWCVWVLIDSPYDTGDHVARGTEMLVDCGWFLLAALVLDSTVRIMLWFKHKKSTTESLGFDATLTGLICGAALLFTKREKSAKSMSIMPPDRGVPLMTDAEKIGYDRWEAQYDADPKTLPVINSPKALRRPQYLRPL